jgi:outer membrane biosynthesis protein TonB
MAETAADGSNARILDDDAKEQQPQSQSQSQSQQPQPQPQSQEQEDREEGTPPRQRLSTSSTSSRPREATELDEIATPSTHSTASLSSGEYRVTPRLSLTSSSAVLRRQIQDGPLQPLRRFWSRNVALVVEQKGNRDYFGIFPSSLSFFFWTLLFAKPTFMV